MQINPYVFLDGRAAEALPRYADILGGQVTALMRYREAPEQAECGAGGPPMPPDWGDKVMHGQVDFPGGTLMVSDPPPFFHRPMQGCHVSLVVDTPDQAERVFAALSEGGETTMPMGPTFWAARFGMCTDRYGVAWMVNCPPAA